MTNVQQFSLESSEFNNKIDSIPEFKDYVKQVEEFQQLDLSGLSLKEIDEKFFKAVHVMPQMVLGINPKMMNEQTFYRVRIVRSGEPKPDLNLVRSFSYPDPHFIKKNGRANLAGTTVFYCSDDINTALIEVCPKAGDTLYLSFWKMKCDRDIVYKGFFPHKSMPKESKIYQLALNYFKNYVDMNVENGAGHKLDQLNYLYDVIAETFTFQKSPYLLSSWLAHNMIYNYFGIDFLLYPSWQTQFIGTNLAMHPNFVDQFLSLDRVYTIEMKVVSIQVPGESTMNYFYGKVGHVEKTNIQWLNFTKEDLDIIEKASGAIYKMTSKQITI